MKNVAKVKKWDITDANSPIKYMSKFCLVIHKHELRMQPIPFKPIKAVSYFVITVDGKFFLVFSFCYRITLNFYVNNNRFLTRTEWYLNKYKYQNYMPNQQCFTCIIHLIFCVTSEAYLQLSEGCLKWGKQKVNGWCHDSYTNNTFSWNLFKWQNNRYKATGIPSVNGCLDKKREVIFAQILTKLQVFKSENDFFIAVIDCRYFMASGDLFV